MFKDPFKKDINPHIGYEGLIYNVKDKGPTSTRRKNNNSPGRSCSDSISNSYPDGMSKLNSMAAEGKTTVVSSNSFGNKVVFNVDNYIANIL